MMGLDFTMPVALAALLVALLSIPPSVLMRNAVEWTRVLCGLGMALVVWLPKKIFVVRYTLTRSANSGTALNTFAQQLIAK